MDSPFLIPGWRDPLAAVLAPASASDQPPLLETAPHQVTAVLASLALGGAERIVLDWAASCAGRYRTRLIVLHDVAKEWPLPPGVEVTRLAGTDLPQQLRAAGAAIASGGNPVVICHLLTGAERAALAHGGAQPVPVLHNARAGWREAADALRETRHAIAVSRHAASELHGTGWRGHCAVIRHVPRTPARTPAARRTWRTRWALPQDAIVIGMIGAVKPQKAYTRALRILAALDSADTYLVIVGGPVGRDGALAWQATLAQARRLGLEERVRLPGFVPGASACLSAFDLVLNSSRYEGLSIATLEALAAGLPVVASAVGGQGELPAAGLALVPFEADDRCWAASIAGALRRPAPLPAWRGAPTHRLWTLFHLLHPFVPRPAILFVTANLNAGGAQRSLVNLALELESGVDFEIAVCGNSSDAHFTRALRQGGVRVGRTADSRDAFDHAEGLVRHVVAQRIGTVCFWNVDAKVKLLLSKALRGVAVRLVDVSPGAYSFEEMDATRAFQAWIAWSADEYYAHVDRVVAKYRGRVPAGVRRKLTTIPNGVPPPPLSARAAGAGAAPRIVMSGRIAPSKFLVEAVAAMRVLWRDHPRVELHLLGRAEHRHAAYARTLLDAIGDERGVRVFLHGAAFDAPGRLGEFTAALVLGESQGSPNAVLEALAAGVPVVANDSGGTRALVVDGRTGVLLRTCDPNVIATGLARVIADPALARRLSHAGRRHVERSYSMQRMADAYTKLFASHPEMSCSD